jgi:hypothetical protein
MQMPSVLMHDLVFSIFFLIECLLHVFCVSLWLFAGVSKHIMRFCLWKDPLSFLTWYCFLYLYSHAQNLVPGNKVSSVYFCTSTVGSLMKSVQESVIMEGSLSLLFMMMMV